LVPDAGVKFEKPRSEISQILSGKALDSFLYLLDFAHGDPSSARLQPKVYSQNAPWPIFVGEGRAAGGQVDINFFYTNLAPYGHWVQAPDYGWKWLPFNLASGWRPYSLGHWAMTDYGWTWVSDESFGWATYHYGRWVNESNYGWGWVPGYDWGPAWVAWRNGGSHYPRVRHGAGVTSSEFGATADGQHCISSPLPVEASVGGRC